VTQDVKPTFVGSQQETDLAGRVFDVMQRQGRFFAVDAPIRQSLQQLSAYFAEQGLPASPDAIDEAITKNPQVFYREERDGEVYYTTTKKGSYTPAVRTRPGQLPVPTQRHMGGYQGKPTAVAIKKPHIVSHDASQLAELQALLKTSHGGVPTGIKEPALQPAIRETPRPPRAQPAPPPPPPAPVKKTPQVETPQGVLISLARSPVEIFAKHRDFFTDLVRERLATDTRFVSFGDQWMLGEQLTTLAKGELRQVREFIESSGGPETDDSLCSNVFNRQPDADPTFRFSLNYQLFADKRVFEFVGTNRQTQWWVAGTQSPRIVRSPLKPAEIGQDLKYLEDEPVAGKLPGHKWTHTLTWYEWENGLLPYSPEAKLLFPAPYMKEQRVAQLRFEAPQFATSAYVELHYPTGNRGGWIEGLGEILAVFLSGAKLIIARDPDKPDTFTITYEEAKPAQESAVLLFDAKRQRFVFQPLPLVYQVSDGYLLERQRFGGLKDARRLDEANRRKGDAVIIFAFEKIGAKSTRDEKTVYRARLDDLLPVVNIEKPFSTASLLRFFATHPHYQRDETEEGYWLYTED
jgi:hypothetical protein